MSIKTLLTRELYRPSAGESRVVAARFVEYAICAGVVFAVLLFGEVIAAKSLGAGSLEVAFLTMTMPVANITSLWWARLLVGRDQRPYLRRAAIAGCVILVTGFFLRTVGHLLFIHFSYFLLFALLNPAENRLLQQCIPSARTGRLYGIAAGLRMGTAALVSGLAGVYLTYVEGGYCHLYAAAGVMALIGIRQLATIRTGRGSGEGAERFDRRMVLVPVVKSIQLLRRRKDYLRFEGAFMLYGIAFMMSLPVVSLFLVEDLALDYATIGLARGSMWQLAMALGVLMFGRVFDRTTPHRLAVFIFLLLSFFPWFLLAAGRLEGTWRLVAVYGGFAMFGVAMGGVMLLWSLSSIRFAGDEDAGVYHSVHVAATGIRGIFAPLLGYFVMTTMGKETALVVISGFWVLASGAMILARVWDIRSREARSLRSDHAPGA